jgi:hypothetical protein
MKAQIDFAILTALLDRYSERKAADHVVDPAVDNCYRLAQTN